MAGAGAQPPAVVGPAAVSVPQVRSAHGKHRRTAIAAEQKAGVHVVIDSDPAIIRGATLFPQLLRGCKRTVIHNRLVMVLKHNMVAFLSFKVGPVDFLSGEFALSQCADIKIVIQNPLYGDDAPFGFCLPDVFLSGGFLPVFFLHARGRDTQVRQMVGDFTVAPALIVQLKNLPDNGGLLRHNGKSCALSMT